MDGRDQKSVEALKLKIERVCCRYSAGRSRFMVWQTVLPPELNPVFATQYEPVRAFQRRHYRKACRQLSDGGSSITIAESRLPSTLDKRKWQQQLDETQFVTLLGLLDLFRDSKSVIQGFQAHAVHSWSVWGMTCDNRTKPLADVVPQCLMP